MVFDDDGRFTQHLTGASRNGSFLGKVTVRGADLDPPASGQKIDYPLQPEVHRGKYKPKTQGQFCVRRVLTHGGCGKGQSAS